MTSDPSRIGTLVSSSKHAPKKPVRMSKLGALRYLNPEEWERTIRKAMESSDGRVPEAAENLGVSSKQLWRMLKDPRLADIERARTGNPWGEKA